MAEWFNASVLPRDPPMVETWPRCPLGGLTRKVEKMYWVYVLYSEPQGRFYIGSSANPDVRLRAHNAGRVRSTKAYKLWKRVWLEEYDARQIAEKRERYLKSGWGRKWLYSQLKWRDGRVV